MEATKAKTWGYYHRNGPRFAARAERLKCSFCRKSQSDDDDRKVIVGPTVNICDKCVKICNRILSAEWEEEMSHEILLSTWPK